ENIVVQDYIMRWKKFVELSRNTGARHFKAMLLKFAADSFRKYIPYTLPYKTCPVFAQPVSKSIVYKQVAPLHIKYKKGLSYTFENIRKHIRLLFYLLVCIPDLSDILANNLYPFHYFVQHDRNN